MASPQAQGPSPYEDTLCQHCEEHAPTAALRDGRAICGHCVPLFAECGRCGGDVEIKYAALVDFGSGYAHEGCAFGEDTY